MGHDRHDNFDNRSFALNEESNVSFTERSLVEALQGAFEADRKASERITIARWKQRGVWTRAQEGVPPCFRNRRERFVKCADVRRRSRIRLTRSVALVSP